MHFVFSCFKIWLSKHITSQSWFKIERNVICCRSMGPLMSMVTCSVTSVTTTASSVVMPWVFYVSINVGTICSIYIRWNTTLAQFVRYLLPPPTSLGLSLPRLTVNQILRSELGGFVIIQLLFVTNFRTTFLGLWVGGWSRSGSGVSMNFWPPTLLRFPSPFLFMWCDRLVKIPIIIGQ